jgi:hypothetical protein
VILYKFNYDGRCQLDNGIIEAVAFQFSKNRGKFYENLVFLGLKRKGTGEIYYYKTEDNQEVDFLIKQGDKISALIQVAESLNDERTRAREINALIKAMGELKINRGLILTYDTEENIRAANSIIMVKPIYKWLLRIDALELCGILGGICLTCIVPGDTIRLVY